MLCTTAIVSFAVSIATRCAPAYNRKHLIVVDTAVVMLRLITPRVCYAPQAPTAATAISDPSASHPPDELPRISPISDRQHHLIARTT